MLLGVELDQLWIRLMSRGCPSQELSRRS
jgi:hypothetical protein